MSWSVNATLGFTNTLLRVVPKLSSNDGVDVIGPRLSAYLDFAMGLRERFEINVAVPFAVAQASESGTAAGFMLRNAGTSAIGDARVGGSVLLWGRSTGPQFGVAATVAVPIGSETSFTGDRGVGAEVVASAGVSRPGYRVIVNGGARFRPEVNYVSSDQGTELIGRAGVLVPVMRHRLMTSLELDMMARASGSDSYKELGSPILALLGARYHFASGFRTGAGVGTGLTEAPGSPALRVLLTFGYSPEPAPPKPKPVPPPEPVDSDGDRIPDYLDKCPTDPEDYNGFEDDDGCPDGPPDPDKPLTLEQVITLPSPIEFKFDTAIMLPGAEVYLLQVLDILKKHPEVTKLEIQGHTSSEGGAEYNMRLSNDRTRTVFRWLVDHGIDAQRLVPRGYGLTVPLVPNDSEPNRQRNRRVQFRLLEQLPGSAPTGAQPSKTPPPAATPPPATPPPATPPPATPPPATSPPATSPPAAPPVR
jgi:outer membrane protein OmpA-like peptidoglycan-associated protein